MQKNCKGFQTHIIFTDILNLKTKKTQATLALTYSSRERIKETEKTVRAAFIFKAVSLLL